MSAWNFQKRFASKLGSGVKFTTIRACRKRNDDPKVGDVVACYEGMRTKSCTKIASVCIINRRLLERVEAPENLTTTSIFKLDGVPMSFYELVLMSINDGFDSINDFYAFFPIGFYGYHYTFEMVRT